MPTFTFNLALLLDRLTLVTPVCLYALGAALVTFKMFPAPEWFSQRSLALAGLTVWLVTAAVDFGMQLRRPFTPIYARAWLDWKNEAGGAILAGSGPTRRGVVPSVTLRPFFRSLPLPALFVVVALCLPARKMTDTRASGAALERQRAILENELDARRENLSVADAEQLQRQLEQMRELAVRSPEAAAEALSSLEKRLAEAEAMRLHRLAGALEAAGEVEYGLRHMRAGEDAGGNGEAALAHKLEAMREALEQLIEGEGGMGAMPEAFQQAWAEAAKSGGEFMSGAGGERTEFLDGKAEAGDLSNSGPLSYPADRDGQLASEQLDKMMQALQGMGEQACGRLSSDEGGEGNGDGEPAAYSPDNPSEAARGRVESASRALDALRREMGTIGGRESPGAGGVDRGRADASLIFGVASRQDDLEVEFVPFPPGGGGDDMLLHRERQRPEENPPEEFRAPWRSAVDTPDSVRAGQGGSGLGPSSRRRAETYFELLQQGR